MISQMVVTQDGLFFSNPSGKELLETFSKSAGTFKRYLAGDWINHMSVSTYFNQSDQQ